MFARHYGTGTVSLVRAWPLLLVLLIACAAVELPGERRLLPGDSVSLKRRSKNYEDSKVQFAVSSDAGFHVESQPSPLASQTGSSSVSSQVVRREPPMRPVFQAAIELSPPVPGELPPNSVVDPGDPFHSATSGSNISTEAASPSSVSTTQSIQHPPSQTPSQAPLQTESKDDACSTCKGCAHLDGTCSSAEEEHTQLSANDECTMAKGTWCGARPTAGVVQANETAFDCEAGASNWQLGWSKLKKAFCCERGHQGCTKENHIDSQAIKQEQHGEQHQEQREEGSEAMMDCVPDLEDSDVGWSDAKKAWCCEHKRQGCSGSGDADNEAGHNETSAAAGVEPSEHTSVAAHNESAHTETSTEAEQNCEEGFADWKNSWDDAKKVWCCEHEKVGCKGDQTLKDMDTSFNETLSSTAEAKAKTILDFELAQAGSNVSSDERKEAEEEAAKFVTIVGRAEEKAGLPITINATSPDIQIMDGPPPPHSAAAVVAVSAAAGEDKEEKTDDTVYKIMIMLGAAAVIVLCAFSAKTIAQGGAKATEEEAVLGGTEDGGNAADKEEQPAAASSDGAPKPPQ